MNEQILYCVQCDESFEFSLEDQDRFDRLGFDPPRRCPACRQHKMRLADAYEGREGRRRARPRRRPNRDGELAYP